ncbi:FAD-binding oxidoreductase [Aquamicrobium segne]|uniref:FAD-binding oxidoreductase n=1 Tax=Aquamicrobium segne TaxID=469547 RepID=A0ABW0GVG8_9HYPH
MSDASLDPALLQRFTGIVGARHALTSLQDIAPYVSEPRGLWHGRTLLVLRPGSVDEVSRILQLATQTQTPIVPQGGNTGLVGGQMPDASGGQVVLCMSRLNTIREIDPLSNTITAEAGVVLQNVQEAAEKVDRLFPLSLASQGSCQLGGNLSSNAGGTNVLAYGNARELCLGLEVVLPTGEVFDDLRKLKKDNTGYDLKSLFIGAEGTLGVITAAVLKLFPQPKGKKVAFAGLPSVQAALGLFGLASEQAGGSLTAFELIGGRPYEFTLAHGARVVRPLASEWPWYALMEISSSRSLEDAGELMEAVLEAALEAGLAGDAVVSASVAQAQALWDFREKMSESQKPEGASIKHDISVPIASIPAFIEQAEKEVKCLVPGARLVCFGHMGDGNLHYNISRPVDAEDADFLALYRPVNDVVHAVVRQFGGSISAEHGIGQLKRTELIATAPPVAIDLMRRMKAVFDPAGIMNPGKVI